MQETISKQKSSRRSVALVLIAGLALTGALVAASRTNKPAHVPHFAAAVAVNTKTVTIPVEGMSCVSCAASVKSGLAALDGVAEVHISLEKRAALVRYDDKKLSANSLKTKIEALGFKAGPAKEGGAP